MVSPSGSIHTSLTENFTLIGPAGRHENPDALGRQLEELRRQQNGELREGDRGEARDYNAKIHELENHMRNDWRELRRHKREDHENEHQDRD